VYAGGKAEEAAADPLSKEWTLCVTTFDVSALPLSRRIVGEVLSVNLVNYLNDISYRIRVSPEYPYYESTAHLKARQEAGKKIAQKRSQRDELLFKGSAEWRYRKDLKAIDAELVKLQEEYAEADAKIPLIEKKPDFRLTGENTRGTFPLPPLPGREYRFCIDQKADGLLTGQISEYHGRIYLVVRIYALYARSVVYEDRVLFSSEDINAAIPEVGSRLIMALEGTPRAIIAVTAKPENAIVSFDRAFAGRGRVEPVERAPGPVEVQIAAPDYAAATVTVDLFAEEFAELQINLSPLGSSLVLLDVPDHPGTAVYQRSLFIGRTPLELNLITNYPEHFSMETSDGYVGSAIIPSGEKQADAAFYFKVTPPLAEGRVDKSRRQFYGAWGRFWFALPLAWMATGIANTVIDAYNRNPNPTREKYDEAQAYYQVRLGIGALALGFGLESLVRYIYYVYTSTKGEPKAVKSQSRPAESVVGNDPLPVQAIEQKIEQDSEIEIEEIGESENGLISG
jgi:hypothetical protein